MNANVALRGAVVAAACVAVSVALAVIIEAAGGTHATAVATGVAALFATAAIVYAALRTTQNALQTVTLGANRLAAAEFDERVAIATGPAEQLTIGFNTMAGRVQELFDEVTAEHARLEAVFDASADGMMAVARDTSVRFINRAGLRMLGVMPEAAIRRPLIEATRDYELDGLVRRAVTTPGLSQTAVITFGPRRMPIRAAAVPILGGGDWAVLLMLTDLTEVNRVDQVRRDFLSNVSHELRTPLASIRALAETLETGAVDPGDETEEFVRRIRQQVDRITALVNELLDLSRIESGAIDLHPEPIDLAHLVAESVSLLRQRAEVDDITIVCPDIPGPQVQGDHASLLRVVNNLLDNAIKYSPPGATVSVEARDEGDLVAVVVRDQGPGILQQDLPRVFERFYKGDPSRSNSGVGLGLAIVKHVVRLHGGTAEATSMPGEGATFTVRLPREFVGSRNAARR